MRLYSLNIKTEGHLLLSRITWFLTYLMLKSVPCHFTLGDVYLDKFVYLYCKSMLLYSPNIEPEGHAVCMHLAWFLMLETGHINF